MTCTRPDECDWAVCKAWRAGDWVELSKDGSYIVINDTNEDGSRMQRIVRQCVWYECKRCNATKPYGVIEHEGDFPLPKDDLIDTLTDILIQTFSKRGMGDDLIEIRQHLAKAEGVEIWEHDSQGELHSLCSAFIQELLWYQDGDRDTWGEEE